MKPENHKREIDNNLVLTAGNYKILLLYKIIRIGYNSSLFNIPYDYNQTISSR